ncbi:MAG: hypothetical protein QF371_02910 [Flavobacteriales bacterium]|nr:hypothetical protein [Flavobacteriales bacterium]
MFWPDKDMLSTKYTTMFETLNKKSFLICFVVLIRAACSFAQTDNVGIGTTTPDPSAVLDVSNPFDAIQGVPSKGMLVPALTQLQRNLMENQYNDTLANGLLIYETDDGNFWYYKYDDPIPATAPYGEWIMISTSSVTPNSGTPTGGIIMWSGTIASIPAGWSLCDGSNGTPDLTDKFIISVASGAENPGTAPVNNEYVEIQNGSPTPPQRRFFKLAYIMKL